MSFFKKDSNNPDLELIKGHTLWKYLLLSAAGGAFFALALPPANLFPLAFAALVPLIWCTLNLDWKRSFLCGWLWGWCWAISAFSFLREIEWIVPWLLAPVMAIWPGVFAALLSAAGKYILWDPRTLLRPYDERKDHLGTRLPLWRNIFFTLFAASLYTVLEWTRSRLFTWNDMSVTQWQNLPFIQIVSITGSYGVIFLIALVNSVIAGLHFRKKWMTAGGVVLLCLLNISYGFWKLNTFTPGKFRWRPALIQGDLSQRRHPGEKQFREAVEIYTALSRKAAKLSPQIIIWPESAVPMPLRAAHPWAVEYARAMIKLLQETRIPMLIGALDFAEQRQSDGRAYGITNSALYLDKNSKLLYKYDKIHRVPYGEYIPFRRFLPGALIRMMDMGRDLTPGVNRTPLRLPDGPVVSTAICYEGVFGYLTRDFARRGANVLLVLSNDAWYPESSEPEQHLANAVMRAVETGLPMLRCGNNGGSGVVLPDGRTVNFLDVKDQPGKVELKRGRAFGIVEVPYEKAPIPTFYVRYGEWLVFLLILLTSAGFISAFYCRMTYLRSLPKPEFDRKQ